MLISYNWLRELTGTKLNPQEVRERLTNVGLAIDAVEGYGDDYVLDVEVSSNRGDCLSHVGVARELAVIEKYLVSSLKFQVSKSEGKTRDFNNSEIRDADQYTSFIDLILSGYIVVPTRETEYT